MIFPELEENVGIAKKRLLQLVQAVPATVNDASEKMLTQTTDRRRARKLLHIILAAAYPLTLTELNIAFSIEDDHRCLEDCDLEPDISFRKTIRTLCGHLVAIIESKVYLIHQSDKDFLVSESAALAIGQEDCRRDTYE